MKPVAKSLNNSSPKARCFSWSRCLRPYLIGFELGLMLNMCLVTSQETPGISAGLHANRSRLHWRKSASSLFYLGSKLAPFCTILVGLI
jgi:hypothetical protein